MVLDDFNWQNFLFITFYHIFLIVGLPVYLYFRTPSMGLIVASIILYILTGISITAGYHRYYAHKSFKPSLVMEIPLLFFGTAATQGNVIEWAHNHRLHHRFVDREGDPYNVKEGFWHAHMGWMFRKLPPVDEKIVEDLVKRKILLIQKEYYPIFMVVTNLIPVLLLGWMYNDYVGAVFISFLLRIFLTHHSIWFINSLGHYYGSQPYSKEHSAVNNFVIALVTFGEGYHNYHHTFANDYRNGLRWWQFDPTKLLIWGCSKLGIAKDLQRANEYSIQMRLLKEDKHLMLEKIGKNNKLSKEVNKTYDDINSRILKAKEVSKKGKKQELKELNKTIDRDISSWDTLCKNVLKI